MNKLLELCRMLGLHPIVGYGMAAVDAMLFAGETATLGASWLISVPVAAVLTIACILVQKYGFKEGWGLAVGKGLIVGLVTAIPAPLPTFVVPLAGGVMGTAALLSGNRALLNADRASSSDACDGGA
jgi:hypothetical protein